MSERTIHPLLKLALEVGPIAIFFLAYRMAPVAEGLDATERQLEQILFATAVFVPTILASLGLASPSRASCRRWRSSPRSWSTVFGGLTLILRDDTFVKMKPTILYALFAGILGFGLLRGQSYLKYLMDELIPMQDRRLARCSRAVSWSSTSFLAVLNEVVWRGWGTDVWVNFRTFVLPLANVAFVMARSRCSRATPRRPSRRTHRRLSVPKVGDCGASGGGEAGGFLEQDRVARGEAGRVVVVAAAEHARDRRCRGRAPSRARGRRAPAARRRSAPSRPSRSVACGSTPAL